MIAGVDVDLGPEAVIVRATAPLTVVSTAVVGGGVGVARSIVNVHVDRGFACEDSARVIEGVVRRRGLPRPCVGLLTAAWTAKADVAGEREGDVAALAVVTVGLSKPIAAGRSPMAVWTPASTINMILIVDATPDAAALVNLVATVTEVKASVLANAGLAAAEGWTATGTATDAIVVAATGRPPRCMFGGPVSALGAVVARAVRVALEAGTQRWLDDNPR